MVFGANGTASGGFAMKVFIRASELMAERPLVVAHYSDETLIRDDAHGEGLIVLTLPQDVITGPSKTSHGFSSLAAGWRERAGSMPVDAEAKRRIEETFPIADQIESMRDVIDSVLKHGADTSKWPADVKQRKAGYDEKWKYVTEVMAKRREHTTVMPRDPSSDKIWPRRLPGKPRPQQAPAYNTLSATAALELLAKRG
jgi:hypothetical protein